MRVELVGREGPIGEAVELATLRSTGSLFIGEPGVGKTRVLDEALERLASLGWHTERFVAADAIRDVPFGPLVSVLPDSGGDRAQLLVGVRSALAGRSAGRPTVIGIDDAHLLDPSSVAIVVDLVHHSDVVVLLTARSTEQLPADLTQLWSGDTLARIEITPLTCDETSHLAASFLGGPVAPELAERVWELTAGVPLFVRELVLDGRASGAITAVDEVWRAAGTLRSGSRLRELIAARLARLDPVAASLLELVAVAEPLPIELLEGDEGAALDLLERRGLATVSPRDDRWEARVEHPLLTEAIRSQLPTRRRLEHLTDVVRRLRATDRLVSGRLASGDALRIARWCAETGDAIDADVLMKAAREALAALDLDLAAELAGRALDARPLTAHLLLGEVLRLQARAEEAEAALSVAAALADDDEQIVRIAMWRSTLRAHHAGDPQGAIELLNAAAEHVASPVRALELRSEAAFLAGILGRFQDALAVNRAILAEPGLDPATTWTASINLLYARTMLGELDGVDDVLAATFAMADRAEAVRPEGVDLLWALYTGIAIQRGELVDAERRIVEHVQSRAARDQIFGLTATILLQLLLFRGSPELVPMADAALANLDVSDPYAARPIALACRALALAGAGDVAAASAALDAVAESGWDDVRAVPFLGRAAAAVTALTDGPDAGAQIAAARGREAIATSHVSFGVLALHDAVRLGRADLVVDDIVAATRSSAPLLVALADHAVAQHGGDGAALDAVAARFASMGARVLVVDAAADAAAAHDDPVAARRSAARAALWARAMPRWLVRDPQIEQPVTSRELDVVERALAGGSSRAIGEQLFVSARTVDNHLQRIYAKLGVGSRSELQSCLRPLPAELAGTAR